MSAVNSLGHHVEQMFNPHGWIPLSTKPHATKELAQAEFKTLIGQPGERRVYEALELHPKEAARVALARVAMFISLGMTPAHTNSGASHELCI